MIRRGMRVLLVVLAILTTVSVTASMTHAIIPCPNGAPPKYDPDKNQYWC